MNLKASLYLSLMIFLTGIIISGLTYSIFVDSWTIQNAERPDIVARGPFLAGMIMVPLLIIATAISSIFVFFRYRKHILIKYILLGIFIGILSIFFITWAGGIGLFYIPGYMLSHIIPYAHYFYYLCLIGIVILLYSNRFRNKIIRDINKNAP